jgi:membrane protein implicated in regulation of membrane protease activity
VSRLDEPLPDEPAERRRSYNLPPAQLVVVAVLLLIPIVALMWVSTYAKSGPSLWGFPFFYWYQFLWVFLAAICTSIAYAIVHAHQDRRDDGSKR